MDKVKIFKGLSVKGLRDENLDKFSTILGDYYGQFTSFCNFVQDQCTDDPSLEDHIKGLECSIDDNGAVFTIGLDNGESKDIHFDKPNEITNCGRGKIVYQNKVPSRHLTIEEIEEKETESERLLQENAMKLTSRSRKKKSK